jgi:hypothetical protein
LNHEKANKEEIVSEGFGERNHWKSLSLDVRIITFSP